MDTVTAQHGLATVVTETNREYSLPSELQKELQSLEEIFTVDAAKLKEISKRFGEELQEGRWRVLSRSECATLTIS